MDPAAEFFLVILGKFTTTFVINIIVTLSIIYKGLQLS